MNLDPSLNFLPDNVRHIHLMGICGTGVGALAGMLQAKGYEVSGSDQNVYPPMSDFLAELGITVMSGYKPENLTPQPDLVIVGNVITRLNPEAETLGKLQIPYLSMPQAVSQFFINGKTSLVVTGTHGKTTTSSLLATTLHYADQDPGFMIGGIVQAFGSNFNIGKGPFVTEGDEYDTAFFDKGPKFLHYQPDIAIITSIEFDHADIYDDLEAIKKSFRRLVAIMPENGCLIANYDDEVVKEICAEAKCPVLSYGETDKHDWRLTELDIQADGTSFTALKNGVHFGRFTVPMPGRHNAMNCLAVIAVMERLGHSADVCQTNIKKFQGVRRRQEVRGIINNITVIDDFAHHPTAVAETLQALRLAYKEQRLVAIFEPRTNSSRRAVFQQDYVQVFDHADEIIIKEPIPLDKISAEDRFSAQTLVDDLIARGRNARLYGDTAAIIDYLSKTAQSGDVLAIMSNGGFDDIHVRLLASLR